MESEIVSRMSDTEGTRKRKVQEEEVCKDTP